MNPDPARTIFGVGGDLHPVPIVRRPPVTIIIIISLTAGVMGFMCSAVALVAHQRLVAHLKTLQVLDDAYSDDLWT